MGTSLSINITGIFSQAFEVVNAFQTLIVAVAGIALGFNILNKIIGLFSRPF